VTGPYSDSFLPVWIESQKDGDVSLSGTVRSILSSFRVCASNAGESGDMREGDLEVFILGQNTPLSRLPDAVVRRLLSRDGGVTDEDVN